MGRDSLKVCKKMRSLPSFPDFRNNRGLFCTASISLCLPAKASFSFAFPCNCSDPENGRSYPNIFSSNRSTLHYVPYYTGYFL